MNLNRLYNNLNSLNVITIAIEIIESLEVFIVQLNQDQMAIKGQRSDGSKIEPDYTLTTKLIKNRSGVGIGKKTDHVTLYNKGDLYKSMNAEMKGMTLTLDATDWKVPDLVSKYGEWRGLDDESQAKLKLKAEPLIIEKIYAKLLS